jgi:hypothetical protein
MSDAKRFCGFLFKFSLSMDLTYYLFEPIIFVFANLCCIFKARQNDELKVAFKN